MDIEEKIKVLRQLNFDDIIQNVTEMTEKLKQAKRSEQDNKEKLILKEKEIEQMLEKMKILEEQLALQASENHILKTELSEKNKEIENLVAVNVCNEREVKVLWTKLNSSREKLKAVEAIADKYTKDEGTNTKLQPKGFTSDAGLKLETSNELQKYTDKSESCNEEICKLKKMIEEKTEEINGLKLEFRELKEEFSSIQAKIREFERKAVDTQKKADKCELNLVHPLLKEMIIRKNWSDCLKILEAEFEGEPTIRKELKYMRNEKEIPVIAVKFGCKNLISLLLTNGLPADFQNNDNDTLLILAIEYGHKNLVEVLLSFKADVNKQGKFSRSNWKFPINTAIKYGHLEIMKMLINNGADITKDTLQISLDSNQFDAAKFLIENGKIKKEFCQTALHVAVQKNQFEIIQMLLSQGLVDVDAVDIHTNHFSAMHFAAASGNIDIIELLIKHNANINIRDNYGYTPLHYAVQRSHVNVVQYLLQNVNCERNVKGAYNRTPLEMATPEERSEFERIFEM